jgi:hypothetical protein
VAYILDEHAVDPDLPRGDCPARIAPAQPGEQRPERPVQRLPGEPCRYREFSVPQPPRLAHFIAIFSAIPPMTGIFQAFPENALNIAISMQSPSTSIGRVSSAATYATSC